ncbi:MAG: hypothetical protein P4M07_01020 [Xanthobacteraceae bacterium]|nr:hypothetical protein [Xanthobacteraceae bacterium]
MGQLPSGGTIAAIDLRQDMIDLRQDMKAPAMNNRNVLYFVIGALVVAVAVLGYKFYQERQKPAGIEIEIGKGGVSIENK